MERLGVTLCYRERVGRWIRGCVFAIRQTYRTKHILKSSYLNWCGLFLWVIFMAIQLVDLKVPNGDTPRSANTKINANFSDKTHAASKLVGKEVGKVPLSEHVGELARSDVTYTILTPDAPNYNVNDFVAGESAYVKTATTGAPTEGMGTYIYVQTVGLRKGEPLNVMQWAIRALGDLPELAIRNSTSAPWYRIYGSYNTTVDGNGLLKPSSPVLRVFSDRIEGNTDGETMGAIFTKNGIGDYTISNTTGLREDGWYITIPNDMNGNPKVAVTLEETDGVISLKSYKRIFSMETFIFGPDLEQPLDIPEGRWIDLRFNEIPFEPTDLDKTNP